MPRYPFIDPADWIPGTIYHARPNDRYSEYLYLDGVYEERRELRIAATGQVVDVTSPYRHVFLRWLPAYDKYLRHSVGWNQILHDLMETTGGKSDDWYRRLTVQDDRPDVRIRFKQAARTLFDPAAVVPETISTDWTPCLAGQAPPGDLRHPSGWWIDDLHGTVPAFLRHSIILTPWTANIPSVAQGKD